MTWIQIDDRELVRWIVLDRPERKNAIPFDGWEELGMAFDDFEASGQRVLIVTGSGGDFCSGADLDPAATAGAMPGIVERERRMKTIAEAATSLHRLTKPTVAAVDGVAVGAGLNLALGCDLVVATSRARFSEIFVRRGLTLDFGGSWLLPRVVGLQRAKEMALTGRIVAAEEAVRIGLCLEVVDPERLQPRAAELAAALLAGAPVAQMFAKQALDHAWDVSFEDALGWEAQSQAICFTTDDVAEGISAFLDKRPPEWKGR